TSPATSSWRCPRPGRVPPTSERQCWPSHCGSRARTCCVSAQRNPRELMTPLFTDAMALRRVRETSADGQHPANRPVVGAVFEAELNRHWTIGPKVHGGAMLALCANAARTVLGDDAGVVTAPAGGTPSRGAAGGRAGQSGTLEPVAVSGSFLWAPD